MEPPIVIFGSGRNGSSALHLRLAKHPNMAWISDKVSERVPERPRLNQLLMRGIDIPILRGYLWEHFRPGEGYMFWDLYSKIFRHPCRDLVADDATIIEKKLILQVFSKLLTPKRSQLLLKITGWPRLGFLNEIFPGAKFIYLIRDGRAVANSLMNIHYWQGWRGPSNWLMGELAPEDRAMWEKFNRSFAALAGIEWNIGCRAAENAIDLLSDEQVIRVRYEDLCVNGIEEMKRIIDFCRMETSDDYLKYLLSSPFLSQNEKWRSDLTPNQQEILTDVTREYLIRYRYPV